MQRDSGEFHLSAGDLSNHLACRHLTQLDRAVAEGRLEPPSWRDPSLALLQERGLAHERSYVEHLRAGGTSVVELRDVDGAKAAERTLVAMRDGAGAIVQASLEGGRWRGRADVLLRVSEPSDLGSWSYEVADTKLAQETRGGTVLQLCLYSDLVGRVQGRPPSQMHVVKPGSGFPRETFRLADFEAYDRLVRRRLEQVLAGPALDSIYPYPIAHCEICRWRIACDVRRHQDDHLSLVAGIRALHVAEIERQGFRTLERFADERAPLREPPSRGSREAFARAHGQARIQLAGRREGRMLHELLPSEPGLGLARLPKPAPGDLFFDIESDPFVDGGGLEYVLGVAFAGDDGALHYRAFQGYGRMQEKGAFEAFIDFVMARWEANPGMHVYHFSPYEPAAVKRLISRHATREAEVDRLLRAGRFVDLHAVTRGGVRASVESYSLKDIERLYRFDRQVDLPVAGAALRRVACALEMNVPEEASDADRAVVEAYNRDDCLSTAALRDWLEERRAELVAREPSLARPESQSGDAPEAVEARAAAVHQVYKQLVEGLPEDRAAWGAEEHAQWLLAHLLDYFRREDKCAWWEFYRIHELDKDELLGERKALAGLEFVGVVGGTAKCPVHRYGYPAQEAALDEGDNLDEVGRQPIGTVSAIDTAARLLDIKKRQDSATRHPDAVMVRERVKPEPMDGALLQLARAVVEHGVDGEGPYRAARDLLLRRQPRLGIVQDGPLRQPGEDLMAAALRLARGLDHGVLPIQGPPGSGKTYMGARMIVELARQGKRIGVTAVSHKVIRKLVDDALDAAGQAGFPLRAMHKVTRKGMDTVRDRLEEITDNEAAQASLGAGMILGGTAWLWARDDMIESLDYLFVDEAGQMSLAHALASGRSARNIVLLGDPQQLEQPQRGAHPEGAEVAALIHILNGRQTISDRAGLFLDETWRLHPDICAFTSEIFYERRLVSRAGLERQALAGPARFAGSGLFYVPVEHEGNQNSSPEEVDAVSRIVEELLGPGATWIDFRGEAKPLEESDILIVAPYNAQVGALIDRLPRDVRVGTVDRFQGQEAPVVIYSMASSSPEDAPRGMGFLYNPNRLNVATSRARCASILVAAPRLTEPYCHSPEQMRWANGLCRFREMAREVTL